MTTVGMISLGCAKNLVDSEQMLFLLKEAGFEITTDVYSADAAVINTCGFIESAQSEAIETILDVSQNGNNKCIIVTGCLAERYKDEILKELPEVSSVVGCGSYKDIVRVVNDALNGKTGMYIGDIDAPIKEISRIVSTPPYTAYLKIAEGCDNRCSYCVIPYLRGKFRSRNMDAIINEARTLAKGGVREIIVVAQDITRYGTDIFGRPMLYKLIEKLNKIEELHWIRLHYMYPDEMDEMLLDTIKNCNKVLHYFDIPIQHISNSVLKRMNRRGTGEEIRALIKKIREKLPDAVIRTSIISGFPGETEKDFEELCNFLREYKIERAGVFVFSAQEGTPAFDMTDRVDIAVAQSRRDRLYMIQEDILDAYSKSLLGKTVEVVCEGMENGVYFGRSYAESPDIDGRINFKAENISIGEFVNVKICDLVDGEAYGEKE